MNYFILFLFTFHLGLAPHTLGRRAEATDCCRNADVAQSPCRTSCYTVPMTTTASSPRSYGNRHKEKLFHKSLVFFLSLSLSLSFPPTQTGVIIQQHFRCYSSLDCKWEGEEPLSSNHEGWGFFLWILRRTWKRRRRDVRSNSPECFVPGQRSS